MKATNGIQTYVLLACLLVVSTTAFGQSEPQTPLGKLARSGGAFLGACEYMSVFKKSPCSYALKKSFPSLDSALVNEVMPAFPPEYQNEVRTSMVKIKPELIRQSKQYVGGIIAAAKKDYDSKTACGVVAGILAGVYGQVFDNWLQNKRLYGRNEK